MSADYVSRCLAIHGWIHTQICSSVRKASALLRVLCQDFSELPSDTSGYKL